MNNIKYTITHIHPHTVYIYIYIHTRIYIYYAHMHHYVHMYKLCTQVSPSFLLARLLNTAPSLGPFLRRDLISNLRLMLRGCTGWAAKYGFAKHGIGTYGIILFICRE